MNRAVIQIRKANDNGAARLEAMGQRFSAVWKSGAPSAPLATFTFDAPAHLFAVLTPKRWELIEHLQEIGPSSMRGLARALSRDIRRVHDDVAALLEWGIVESTGAKIWVPFDVIHADFDLRAVA
ncbi:transcriptional regulator [Mesorhizobium sp. NBSH29]|uniref:HVO_A0114 family putative DNA-binding protein n=1 Tax=Mesorhizobium sp. NBSH29 TaxID=2654249 RepID=UPI00189654BD|nr:transcriptional regulator [Mesorhizobium sp. NBSH29]QPC85468.1 transcriptional regulator [Mesorhizobium sp. NBSH29]